jgi:hypothetical protein
MLAAKRNRIRMLVLRAAQRVLRYLPAPVERLGLPGELTATETRAAGYCHDVSSSSATPFLVEIRAGMPYNLGRGDSR